MFVFNQQSNNTLTLRRS